MKYLTIIVVFLIGIIVLICGALLKLMHWPGASLMLVVGFGIKALAVILLIIKLIMHAKTNEFLNK